MKDTIKIRDDIGEIEIHYGELLKYHGRDFFGGVALAFKVLKLSFDKLLDGKIPHRNQIRLVVGFDPPGVIDAFEFITRAITQRRLILDPHPEKGPDSVFGRYYFEVRIENQQLRLWLKTGILPEDFTMLARKAIAGIATSEELSRWKEHKENIGHKLMDLDPEEILHFEGPLAAA